MKKTQLATVSILVLLATFIAGLSVRRMCLERRKADLYAVGEAALAAHQWDEALARFETLSALDPNYRDMVSD